jgi:hypothetical protein
MAGLPSNSLHREFATSLAHCGDSSELQAESGAFSAKVLPTGCANTKPSRGNKNFSDRHPLSGASPE